jgi:hypothetical protein
MLPNRGFDMSLNLNDLRLFFEIVENRGILRAARAFVLADTVEGTDYRFRHMLEVRQQLCGLAERGNQTLRFMEE